MIKQPPNWYIDTPTLQKEELEKTKKETPLDLLFDYIGPDMKVSIYTWSLWHKNV